jgi:hypothetical protein
MFDWLAEFEALTDFILELESSSAPSKKKPGEKDTELRKSNDTHFLMAKHDAKLIAL